MSVSADFWSWSSTAASNSPAGSDTIGTTLDDILRSIQAAARGAMEPLSSVAGTNTITASATNLTAYVAGLEVRFTPVATNTGATTINISSLGAKNVYARNAACVGGELVINVPAILRYDGTQFQIVASGADVSLTATQTLTNKTLTTPTLSAPTIADFSNAQHSHAAASSGGTIAFSALTGTVSQAQIGAVVGQGQLKSTTADYSTQSATGTVFDSAAGEYGFQPQVQYASAGTAITGLINDGARAVHNFTDTDNIAVLGVDTSIASPSYTSSTGNVSRFTIARPNGGASETFYMHQRYVQASPPYDLGDGEIPLFVFALVRSNGEIEYIYCAP